MRLTTLGLNLILPTISILLALAGTEATMLAYNQSEGLTTGDISVDLAIPANRNLPHDPHPSPAANRQYAQKLETFLRNAVLK